MSIIEAIKKALEVNRNVIATEPFQFGVNIMAPGIVKPQWLIDALSQISEEGLFADTWEVEEDKITITCENLMNVLQSYNLTHNNISQVWSTLKYIVEKRST